MTWKAKLRFCTQELNAGDRIKHNEWMKWIIWARWVTAGPAVTDQLPDPAALCLWSSVGRHISAVTHSCRWKTDSRSVTPTPLGRTGRLARCVCVCGFLSTECSCGDRKMRRMFYPPLISARAAAQGSFRTDMRVKLSRISEGPM